VTKEEEQQQRRAEDYMQLVEFGPFQRLVEEMGEMVDDFKEAVINDTVNDRLLDKGIVTGIRIAMTTPRQAVEEFKRSEENSEPS